MRAAAAVAIVVGFVAGAHQANAKYASIVIEEKTGRVLHAVNADAPHYPASLTKMMTLYLVFQALHEGKLKQSSLVTFSPHAARQPPSKLGVKAGDSITVHQAILALIVRSANDVAAAVAETMAGSERAFAKRMTAKARALGMAHTTFRNASGLPHHLQRTTARDIATLVVSLRRDFPKEYAYFKTRHFTFRGRTMDNHNRLLDRYEGADGAKTGYIRASGFNLAASAERVGARLIAVVLGARTPRARDLHTMGLLERGFETLTGGRYIAYDYDRNIRVSRRATWIHKHVRVTRAHGARGRIRLARLIPPHRPIFLDPATEQGSGPEPRAQLDDGFRSRAWSIQVGAFSRFASAHLAATRALRKLPLMLGAARPHIAAMRDGRQITYRAQLAGLDRVTAERACTALHRQGIACLTVNPGGFVSEIPTD